MDKTTIGNTAIDYIFDLFGGFATVVSFVYGLNIPLIHIQFPPFILQSLQAIAFGVSISVGTLTLFNLLGYEPLWLNKTKNYFKNKSKKNE